MVVPISKTMMQEHAMNPIYEAFKRAGVKFVNPYIFADGTGKAAEVLKGLGFIVELDKKDNSLQAAGSVEIKREYCYPVAMLEKVAQVLGIEKDFADLRFLRLELVEIKDASPMLVICAGGQTQREVHIAYLASLGLDESGLPLPKGKND